MAFEPVMIITLPGLEGVAKLLAVLVAFYFPLVVLVWFAVDKLPRTENDRPEAAPPPVSAGAASLGVIRVPRGTLNST